MNEIGWKMRQRVDELWRSFHPEHFTKNGEEWCLEDYAMDYVLSKITERRLLAKVANDPELRLDNWGNLPQRIADPQMKLL